MKSKNIHKNKYGYDFINYINNSTKVNILCKKCNDIFEQTPQLHLKGCGCLKCYRNTRVKSTNQFIIDAKNIHGDKYDYSLVSYINNITKVKIICPIHNMFEQSPNVHLNKKGCPKCHDDIELKNKKLYILYDKKYNLYKIGYSKNVIKRKKGIECFLKYKLEIIEIFENKAILENFIHKEYYIKRVNHPIKHGGYKEWFTFDYDEMFDVINILKIM